MSAGVLDHLEEVGQGRVTYDLTAGSDDVASSGGCVTQANPIAHVRGAGVAQYRDGIDVPEQDPLGATGRASLFDGHHPVQVEDVDPEVCEERQQTAADGRIEGHTQAGYALALRFDLLPEELRSRAARHMVEALDRYNGHLSTGIQTTNRLMLELTRNGYDDEAYRLLNLRTFPSWGFMIENGATTIWERWDGYVKGRGFQNPGMNSFNHWAIGAVGEWMWRHIIGIQPDEAQPGFKHFVVWPRPGGGLTWARGAYESIRGQIASDWKIEDGTFSLAVTVPVNTSATVYVPTSDTASVQESGKPARQAKGVRFLHEEDGNAVYSVGSGTYEFAAPAR